VSSAKAIFCFVSVALLLAGGSVRADDDSSSYIQWRGDYFGDEIDYLDYINSAAGGTAPQSLANNAFEVGKSFGRLGGVKYGYIVNRGKATRNTQPFKISSATRAHQIGFSKALGSAFSHRLLFSSSLQFRSQGEEAIQCFERLGVVVGGNAALAGTLEQVVSQMDILAQTVALLEQRLSLSEDRSARLEVLLRQALGHADAVRDRPV
jgi:hypothetical protein